MSTSKKQAIIIFIKNPVLGKAKTRIAKEVGDQKALDIYKALLEHTRKVVSNLSVTKYLFYSDNIITDEWDAGLFEKRLQVGLDLGERMKNAFTEVLKDMDQAIIIGSDCVQLNSEIITNAFTQLSQNDTVIGPTFDGGYYLLGMKQCHDFLFENMKWSTDSVCQDTMNRIKQNNLTHAETTKLSDIDYWHDWQKYGWELS